MLFSTLIVAFVWNEPKLNTLWSTSFLWKLKSGKEVFCRMWFSFTHGRTHLTAISLEVIGGSYCFFLLDRRPSKESLIFCGCGQTWTGMKKLGKIPRWISVHKFYWKWSKINISDIWNLGSRLWLYFVFIILNWWISRIFFQSRGENPWSILASWTW